MNLEVTTYIDNLSQDWQTDLCRRIRQIILNSIPDVAERIQYGKPHFLKNGKYVCVLGTAKAWVSLTLFNAQALKAPDGYFEPSDTAARKTVKFRQDRPLEDAFLAGLVQQAASKL